MTATKKTTGRTREVAKSKYAQQVAARGKSKTRYLLAKALMNVEFAKAPEERAMWEAEAAVLQKAMEKYGVMPKKLAKPKKPRPGDEERARRQAREMLAKTIRTGEAILKTFAVIDEALRAKAAEVFAAEEARKTKAVKDAEAALNAALKAKAAPAWRT